jgi:DNA-binding transcriptional LysR family regulator
MNLNDLASFVRVVDLGTISAAAAAEGVPKSTISRRIARLEDELGVELLRRSARAFVLTEDGQLLHARSVAALQELVDIERQLTEVAEVPRGRLVVSGPRDIAGSDTIAKLFAEYRASYPAVDVEVRLEARYVDLIAENVDVALRAHGAEIPGGAGLMSRLIGASQGKLYTSPDYLARRGKPRSIAELAKHDLVLHKLMSSRPLVMRSTNGDERTLDVGRVAFSLDDFGLIRRMVEVGAGIGLLAEPGIGSSLRAGNLVPVLPAWSMQLGRLSLVWPASRHLSPRVRSFVDLATRRLANLAWVDE